MADGIYWDRAKETRTREEREAEVLANLQKQLHYVYENCPSIAATMTSTVFTRIR